MIDVARARRNFRKHAGVQQDPVEKMAATHVTSFGDGGGGFPGGMSKMPPASVGGGFGGASIVGGWGGGSGKLVGSDAGSVMVARHRANMMLQGMRQQDDFNRAYAHALQRMSRSHARMRKQGSTAGGGSRTS